MPGFYFDMNWEEKKKRYLSWWSRENDDRPLFYMCVHDEEKDVPLNRYFGSPEDRWLNTEKILEREEKKVQESFYPAEGFPGISACLGPGSLATFLGSEPSFKMDTVWYEPCINDITKADIVLNRSSKWWQWTVDFTRKAIERGKFVVEMPDLIENFDTLASLLGAENLLYSIYDHPKDIHRLQRKLLDAWFEAFEEIYRLIKDEDGGMSFGGFGIWTPGRFAKLQCDAAATLSGDMFEEFVLPYLKEQYDRLDYSLYHLDCPNALQTFDHVLSIEALGAIQWQPGTANPPATDPCWDFIYKKILDSGKSILTLMRVDTEENIKKVEAFVKRIGRKGVLILTEPHPSSPEQAEEILERSYYW